MYSVHSLYANADNKGMQEIITTINILLAAHKKAKEISDKLSDNEIKGIIADMGGQIINLEMVAKERKLEIESLKTEIKKLKTVKKRKVVFKDYAFFDRETNEGPFCPDCYRNKTELNTMSTCYPLDNLIKCGSCGLQLEKYRNY